MICSKYDFLCFPCFSPFFCPIANLSRRSLLSSSFLKNDGIDLPWVTKSKLLPWLFKKRATLCRSQKNEQLARKTDEWIPNPDFSALIKISAWCCSALAGQLPNIAALVGNYGLVAQLQAVLRVQLTQVGLWCNNNNNMLFNLSRRHRLGNLHFFCEACCTVSILLIYPKLT